MRLRIGFSLVFLGLGLWADQESQAARFTADTSIAESERDFAIQKAAYDEQTNAHRAAFGWPFYLATSSSLTIPRCGTISR